MKRIVMIVMVAAFVLPTMAQEWQSTSTMLGTGSSYAPQVTAVGATAVTSEATTTESYSPSSPSYASRRGFDIGGDAGQGPSPVGDAVVPLLLCAAVFCGVIYFRRKREALKS